MRTANILETYDEIKNAMMSGKDVSFEICTEAVSEQVSEQVSDKASDRASDKLSQYHIGEIGTSVTPLNILLCHIKAAIGESEE